MSARAKDGDILSGALVPRILAFTLPIIFSGILQLLFNAADLVVVGRFDTVNGSDAQAAISSTSSLINLIVNVFIGLSIGVNVVIAHLYGSRDTAKLTTAVQTSVVIGAISGIAVAIVGFVFAAPMLEAMGTDRAVLPLAVKYLRIYFLGAPCSMLYNFGSAVMRASGDTKRPMIYLTAAGVVNVLLNLFMIIVLDLSVTGVAIATAVSNLISCVLIIISLIKTDKPFRLVLRGASLKREWVIRIIKIGLPAGFQGALFSLSNVVIQSAVNSFGVNVMAGNGIASSVEGFIYVAMHSFSQASITFTGQCCGAKKYHLINRIAVTVTLLATASGLILGWAAYFLREPLLGIYSDNPLDISAGLIRAGVILRVYFICGMMDAADGVIRGMGYSLSPTVITLIGACGFRILWIVTVFRHYHTLFSLYVSYPISWIMTFVALTICFFITKRRLVAKNKTAKFSNSDNPV